jgi:hypothetical protein
VEQNNVNIDDAQLYSQPKSAEYIRLSSATPISMGCNTAESASNERSEYGQILHPDSDSLSVPMKN